MIDHAEHGVDVIIRRSKTDQQAKGERIAIVREADSVYCPVNALEIWLRAAAIADGALFRRISRGDHFQGTALSAQSVALIVKQYAQKAHLDPAQFAGHNLRSGFLTSAARKRASIF